MNSSDGPRKCQWKRASGAPWRDTRKPPVGQEPLVTALKARFKGRTTATASAGLAKIRATMASLSRLTSSVLGSAGSYRYNGSEI